jgi:YVTN family beta-propeller protein
MLITGARSLVSMSPQEGFLHPKFLTDTLGYDEPETKWFTKDGKYVFVALGPGNRVAVIDPKTYEVKQYILVGQRPWHLELSSDQSKLYVAKGLTNDMTVIDVASLKAEKSVPVGRLPWGVAVVK